jgi:AcrR family transcriptional regulator
MRLPAAQRRTQLLATAVQVFAVEGYHQASMNGIASAAGVTKPVLYQHFESKHQLFAEVLEEVGAQLGETVTKAAAGASGPHEQIERGFQAWFQFVSENPDAFRVLFGPDTRGVPEFADEVRRFESSIAEVVAEFIEIPDISIQHRLMLGHGIVGLAEGACRFWLHHGVDVDAAVLADQVSQLAWAGLRGIES